MTRTLTALLLAGLALFGTAACGDDPELSGDSNPDSFQEETPAPVPS
jgi:hypothetical protein